MTIGDRIKIKRKTKSLTLEELAVMVKVSRQTLSRYETGIISNIPSDKIELLANALDTTPAYLMGWEISDDPTPPNAKKPGQDDINLDELEFALFGEVRELNDEEKEELLRMARRMRELDELRKEKDKQ